MTEEGLVPAYFPRLSRLVKKFRNKDYKDSYVQAHTKQILSLQMRNLRGDKSQTEFARELDKRQTVISRLEDANYGKWTLQTLFEVARKKNVAVFVRFVSFSKFLKYSNEFSEDDLLPLDYEEEKENIENLGMQNSIPLEPYRDITREAAIVNLRKRESLGEYLPPSLHTESKKEDVINKIYSLQKNKFLPIEEHNLGNLQ